MTGHIRKLISNAADKVAAFNALGATGKKRPLGRMTAKDRKRFTDPDEQQALKDENRKKAALANNARLREQQAQSGLMPGSSGDVSRSIKTPTKEDLDETARNMNVTTKDIKGAVNYEGNRVSDKDAISSEYAVHWNPSLGTYTIPSVGEKSPDEVREMFNTYFPPNFTKDQVAVYLKKLKKEDADTVRQTIVLLAQAIRYKRDGAPLANDASLVSRAEKVLKYLRGNVISDIKQSEKDVRKVDVEFAKGYDPTNPKSREQFDSDRSWQKVLASRDIDAILNWLFSKAAEADKNTEATDDEKMTVVRDLVAKLKQVVDDTELFIALHRKYNKGA